MSTQTAKEILKKRGYTDAELDSMSTLLSDRRFCSAIEDEANEAERLRTVVTETEEWYNKVAMPAVEKSAVELAEAQGEVARVNARMESLKRQGLLKVAAGDGSGDDGGGDPVKPVDSKPDVDPVTGKFVTQDDLSTMAAQFGDSVSGAIDIPDDHRDLFGSRLPGGITGLRTEYKEAVSQRRFAGTLAQFWEKKFNVAAKREELSAKAKEDEREKIRAEVRAQMADEMGNPMLRQGVVSNNPFTNRAASSKTPDGKPASATKPWERSEHERAASRVNKFARQVVQ